MHCDALWCMGQTGRIHGHSAKYCLIIFYTLPHRYMRKLHSREWRSERATCSVRVGDLCQLLEALAQCMSWQLCGSFLHRLSAGKWSQFPQMFKNTSNLPPNNKQCRFMHCASVNRDKTKYFGAPELLQADLELPALVTYCPVTAFYHHVMCLWLIATGLLDCDS